MRTEAIAAPGERAGAPKTHSARQRLLSGAVLVASVVAGLSVWQIVSTTFFSSILFPTPAATFVEAVAQIKSGSLFVDVGASLARILVGFGLGSVIGISGGLLIGYFPLAQAMFSPYLQFFRFIPPIAWVSPAMIWFGIGENSKIFIIVYGTIFTVALNTVAGAASVHRDKIRAARMFGAREWQVFLWVIVPSTVSYILTGMRLAMGVSFMTVVAAEMLAAQSGIGYLIINSRLWMATDRIFVGILALGCLGYATDKVFDLLIKRFAWRYNPNTTR
jgi:NitT/TauT family transport system permease protein